MNIVQIRKQAPWLMLLMSGMFILIAFLFSLSYMANHKPDKLVSAFAYTLNERYKKTDQYLENLSSQKTGPTFESLSKFSDGLDKNYSLFVFKDDLLFYWSDNSIYPDISTSDSLFHTRIIKAGNGLYQIGTKTSDNYTYIISDLIKSDYSYQNEYLSPAFNPAYSITPDFEVTMNGEGFPVKDSAGRLLLSLNQHTQTITYSNDAIAFLYLLYLFGFITLVIAIYLIYLRITPLKNYPILIILFVIDVFIIRATLIYFNFPSSLYTSGLFSPVNFAYSSFLPSLGDFFTDSLVTALLFYLIYRIYSLTEIRLAENKVVRNLISTGLTTIAVFFFYFSCYLLNILINNSSFSLNLSNISEFSVYGIMAYFIIAFILAAFYFISFTIYKRVILNSGLGIASGIFLVVNLLFFLIGINQEFFVPERTLLILQGAYFICLILIFTKIIRFPNLTSISILVLILTMVSSYSLYINKSKKEKNERKLIALRLSSDRDKMGEFLFADIEKKIQKDFSLERLYHEAWADPSKEAPCVEYVKSSFFKGYWSRYNIQVTLCFPGKSLQIRPSNYIIGCQEYFSDIIKRLGETTASPSLYFIRESYDASSYMANIPMSNRENGNHNAYLVIELSPKYVPKGLGYPELLMDNSSTARSDMSDYSYSIFFRDELVKNVGEYNYGVNETRELSSPADFIFFDKNGYNHLYHIINKDTRLVISKRNEGLLDKLSPFTYQLVFHIFLILAIFLIYNLRNIGRKRNLDFKTRLQLMVIILVLFASMSVGLTTLINIRNLNDKKNRDMLSEKAHSVLIELEHKLASLDILDKSQKVYLEELLTKFSLVYFSDINLYDINGRLLASSRPQIFDEGLKSELMSAGPYSQLARNRRTLFIDNEKIGNYKYLSAYLPFRNEQNKLTAYINLPYFAREQELRQEISAFLVAFINIYVILTVLAVFISILAGNYLMRPLQIIRNRFSSLNLGRTNEKITYTRKDELGDLINEYNMMVDKLSESADKLARSERESAWREMARQVAHEIKNPLTPMKLNIQHLRKSWDDKAPDWENRLDKTTHTLIEQIDSLAAIASAFSDFAKLPAPLNKKTELGAIIRNTLTLFNQHPEIKFSFTHPDGNYFVFADEKQLSRVFINLFNNAVQAVPSKQKGQVHIQLLSVENFHRIEISDNGSGIDEEKKSKIFSPNFTTKSGGMGLGLAMVKNIIDNAGGEISFASEKGSGTTFIITLPVLAE